RNLRFFRRQIRLVIDDDVLTIASPLARDTANEFAVYVKVEVRGPRTFPGYRWVVASGLLVSDESRPHDDAFRIGFEPHRYARSRQGAGLRPLRKFLTPILWHANRLHAITARLPGADVDP